MTSDAPVAGLVLAAGGGRRYGMPKALVEYGGSLLVERAVRTANAVCDPVLVVLGAQAVEGWRTADLTDAVVLVNPGWEGGMASRPRTGLDGLRGWPGRVDAVLVQLVDMPGMTPAALERMAVHAAPDALAGGADGRAPGAARGGGRGGRAAAGGGGGRGPPPPARRPPAGTSPRTTSW